MLILVFCSGEDISLIQIKKNKDSADSKNRFFDMSYIMKHRQAEAETKGNYEVDDVRSIGDDDRLRRGLSGIGLSGIGLDLGDDVGSVKTSSSDSGLSDHGGMEL